MHSANGKRVGIVSYALTSYKGEPELLGEESVFTVSKSALDKAGVSRDEIDAVAIATTDFNDGITISIGPLAPAAGGYQKDAVRLENGGVSTLISAYTAIGGGTADYVLVTSADAAAFDTSRVSNFAYDAFFRRYLGINSAISSAMLAADYMRRCGFTEEDYAMAAAKNYAAGAANPYAHIKKGYSKEEILASPLVSWPLREYECCTQSFGGAALLLASEEKAKRLSHDPIWIVGCGMASEPYFADWDEITKMTALRSAAKAAFKMAGVKNPRKEFDVAEIFNPYSSWELIEYEVLGLCDPGKAASLLHEGVTSINGELPVNVSGGTLCTHGPNSSGLFSTIQAALYLRGELPGSRQGARKAIVCDSDVYLGNPGASYAVIVLEKE